MTSLILSLCCDVVGMKMCVVTPYNNCAKTVNVEQCCCQTKRVFKVMWDFSLLF